MSRDVTHPVTRMSRVTSRVTCGVTWGVMMLTPLEAIVEYVSDETTLAKCVGDDERLEAALIAGAHSGRLTERLAEAAGIDLTKAQELLGDLA